MQFLDDLVLAPVRWWNAFLWSDGMVLTCHELGVCLRSQSWKPHNLLSHRVLHLPAFPGLLQSWFNSFHHIHVYPCHPLFKLWPQQVSKHKSDACFIKHPLLKTLGRLSLALRIKTKLLNAAYNTVLTTSAASPHHTPSAPCICQRAALQSSFFTMPFS